MHTNTSILHLLLSLSFAVPFCVASAASFEGAEIAPDDVKAKDLSVIKDATKGAGDPVLVVDRDKCARMTIVCARDDGAKWAAEQLRQTILEMTGVKLALIVESEKSAPYAPALYVGATRAAEKAGLKGPADHPEAYSVVTRDGSVYFLGRADYAVTDWCERVLGVRFYWPETHGTNLVYGKCVARTRGLAAKPWSWSDRPVYAYRDNWPYEWHTWNRWSKGGSSFHAHVNVHAPHGWWKEKDAKDHLEIFALSEDGKRPNSPLLCYGNPKTLEYYKMRVAQAIAEFEKNPKAKDLSGGVVNYRTKVITVSQWDCGVFCACEHCKKLFDPKLGGLGSGSPIIWGYFTKEFAKWVKAKYPGWTIAILPYSNTCLPSPGLDYTAEGNVVAELCTMPGLAMLKNPDCKKYEEDLIRSWQKATGNPVLNWHYSCWPAEFTAAPFVYGETIQKHYKDMNGVQVGSFINGGYDVVRFSLSLYVWMRCLWNPDLDLKALYDGFSRRMFGKAAGPMREIIDMQEKGWNRPWVSNTCSPKNIYKISYPRKEVLKMIDLFAKAEKLAAGDEKALARIAWYKAGFKQFFIESEQNESGLAFPPFRMKKVTVGPKLDGALDDACWKDAEPLPFVASQINWGGNPAADKGKDPRKPPEYKTEARAVWVPSQGVTFGLKFYEPSVAAMREGVKGDVWDQDMIEFFIDFSGAGEGEYAHILSDAFARYRFAPAAKLKTDQVVVKTAKSKDFWTMELYVPFSAVTEFRGVQIPTTSANGCKWTGNLIRFRCGDCKLPEAERKPGSKTEISRLNTRFNKWNRDPAAYSNWTFVE